MTGLIEIHIQTRLPQAGLHIGIDRNLLEKAVVEGAITTTTEQATMGQATMDRATMEQVAMAQVMLTGPHQAASACVLTVDDEITTMTAPSAGAGAATGAITGAIAAEMITLHPAREKFHGREAKPQIISPHPARENFHGREAKRGLAGEKDEVRAHQAHGELMVLTPSHTAHCVC